MKALKLHSIPACRQSIPSSVGIVSGDDCGLGTD